MKAFVLSILAGMAQAHYTFQNAIYNGQTFSDWQYVRKTENYQSHGPVTDVNSNAMRCYQISGGSGVGVLPVTAGSTVGFRVDGTVGHPGPLSFYMARATGGAASFEPAGNVWFKIYEERPTVNSTGLYWSSMGKQTVSVQIPSCIPSGEYLLRAEHIALHSAGSTGGAQIYIGCAQINVSGGGSKSPSGLVSFPGAYKATDPGILINIYWLIPTSYSNPGPRPFTC